MASMQQTQGQGKAADELAHSAKNSASVISEKASSATHESTKESAQMTKEESAGILQQTGEQVKNMAQGAMDTVTDTLGMNDKNK